MAHRRNLASVFVQRIPMAARLGIITGLACTGAAADAPGSASPHVRAVGLPGCQVSLARAYLPTAPCHHRGANAAPGGFRRLPAACMLEA